MPEHVLDTMVLQVMGFADPNGIDILLAGLDAVQASFPAEVYNRDENALPLASPDDELSEFARGLRYAARQVRDLAPATGERYATWLRNAGQLAGHFERESLVVDPLVLEELRERETLMTDYGIGRGEAACLVLVGRHQTLGVFLSSDDEACEIARRRGLSFVTLRHVLEGWVARSRPPRERLDQLIAGMRAARFGLKSEFVEQLHRLI